jgi:hypothetical protein
MEATTKQPVCFICVDCDHGPTHAANATIANAAGQRMLDMQRDPKRRKEEFERVAALVAAAVDIDSLRAADTEVYWIRAGFTQAQLGKLAEMVEEKERYLGVEL